MPAYQSLTHQRVTEEYVPRSCSDVTLSDDPPRKSYLDPHDLRKDNDIYNFECSAIAQEELDINRWQHSLDYSQLQHPLMGKLSQPYFWPPIHL